MSRLDVCSYRLSRTEVDSERPVLGGAAGLGCAAEYIAAPGDLKVHETRADDRHLELSFQESTGNSTGPKVDLLPRALGHRVLNQNVADLDATSRFEHAGHFR